MSILKNIIRMIFKLLVTFIDFFSYPSMYKYNFPKNNSFETVLIRKLGETSKAFYVEYYDNYKTWLPKSQIKEIALEESKNMMTITIPEWLFDKKFK